MKRLLFSAILVITAAFLAACSRTTPEPVTYTLEMTEYGFSPAELEVKVGQPVTIEVVNSGLIEHEVMFGRDVRMMDNRPSGFEHDMFAEAGVEPMMQGGEANMHMDEEAEHGESAFMLVLSQTGDRGTISFTPTEAMVGEWEIGCFEQDGVHYTAGMKGALSVTK